jgi:hypothetical protein
MATERFNQCFVLHMVQTLFSTNREMKKTNFQGRNDDIGPGELGWTMACRCTFDRHVVTSRSTIPANRREEKNKPSVSTRSEDVAHGAVRPPDAP